MCSTHTMTTKSWRELEQILYMGNKHLLLQFGYSEAKKVGNRHFKIVFQKMYKDEAEKMLCNYSAVLDTPEMERIKNIQKNISSVSNSASLFTFQIFLNLNSPFCAAA